MFRALILLCMLLVALSATAGEMQTRILAQQRQWAAIKYQWPKAERRDGLKQLLARSARLRADWPGKADPLVWHAVVLYTYAGETGGLRALRMVVKAHRMLLDAEKIRPGALNGYVWVALGSLYYKTPGPPIAFGDDKKAERYLRKAVRRNPEGLDGHYFLGDFLLRHHRYGEAAHHLALAVNAPPRPSRPLADAGRKRDARRLLSQARAHLH